MSSPIVLTVEVCPGMSSSFTQDDIEHYLDALEFIKKDSEHWKSFQFGICAQSELMVVGGHVNTYLLTSEFAKKWDKHSGNNSYPVPYDHRTEYCYSWNPESRVGKLRWELLDFLIQEVKSLLKQHQESEK